LKWESAGGSSGTPSRRPLGIEMRGNW